MRFDLFQVFFDQLDLLRPEQIRNRLDWDPSHFGMDVRFERLYIQLIGAVEEVVCQLPLRLREGETFLDAEFGRLFAG